MISINEPMLLILMGVCTGGVIAISAMWLSFLFLRSAYTNTPVINKKVIFEEEEELIPETTEAREVRESLEMAEFRGV